MPSEWPQFAPQTSRFTRRSSTNPSVNSPRLVPSGTPRYPSSSTTGAQYLSTRSTESRRSSPLGMSESLIASAPLPGVRSVPITPLNSFPPPKSDLKYTSKGSRVSHTPYSSGNARVPSRRSSERASPHNDYYNTPPDATKAIEVPLKFKSIGYAENGGRHQVCSFSRLLHFPYQFILPRAEQIVYTD